jgi:peroxiredoxin
MRKPSVLLALFAASAVGVFGFIPKASALTLNAQAVAAVEFSAPTEEPARNYLGVSGAGKFRLTDVKAEILIVEAFSMYCPYCQSEAPNVNRLHVLIQADAKLKDRIKLIGVGLGNTAFEVAHFAKKFNVPFPLVPDPDFSLEKCADASIRTPTFVILGNKGGAGGKPIKVHVGKIGDAEEFLKSIAQP